VIPSPRSALWSTDVLEVTLHPGRVTELKLRKPGRIYNSYQTFDGKPGQYCFVKVPALASYEWHPFSLTSASHDDFISFHIQGESQLPNVSASLQEGLQGGGGGGKWGVLTSPGGQNFISSHVRCFGFLCSLEQRF